MPRRNKGRRLDANGDVIQSPRRPRIVLRVGPVGDPLDKWRRAQAVKALVRSNLRDVRRSMSEIVNSRSFVRIGCIDEGTGHLQGRGLNKRTRSFKCLGSSTMPGHVTKESP